MISAIITSTLLFLAFALVSSASGRSPDTCVTSFSDFEKAAITDSASNVQALVKAFYQTNSIFPLSVQVVYHVNSSNETDTIISSDPDHCAPGKEVWLWVSSPVFIFIDPTRLNSYALFTLNYFSLWEPRVANIYVPNICNISHNQFNFLNDLTMQVHTYAARHISGERGQLGYVLRGCRDDPEKLLLATATLPGNRKNLEKVSRVMVYAYVGSNLFQAVLILLVSVLFLHKKGHTISSSNSPQPSFENYGLFWGCVAMSALVNVPLLTHGFYMVALHVTSGVNGFKASGFVLLTQGVLTIIASLMVAIYYGRKLSFEIPSIFLLPFAILCCNHANETSKKIVQCLSIWSLLLFILNVSLSASFIFLALLSRPPIVLSATLVYICALFYVVHLLAIIFTFAKAKKMHHWKKNFSSVIIELVQIILFVIISASAICFVSIIGYIGVLASYGAVVSNPQSFLSLLILPSTLAAFGWALRNIGSHWFNTFISPYATEAPEQKPLLQAGKCEEENYAHIGEISSNENVLERRSTLLH